MVPQLYSWYEKQKRPLPWRKTVDPYKIWLSEVMLQQTQVDTVIPYYKRWLNELPTLKNVADSTLETTLKLWEGLGYYARCRNFHKACQIVEKEFSGQVPVSRKVFMKLPGVGEYTAAAVLSIASVNRIQCWMVMYIVLWLDFLLLAETAGKGTEFF